METQPVSHQRKPEPEDYPTYGPEQEPPKPRQADAWAQMEATYSTGGDFGLSELPPMCYSTSDDSSDAPPAAPAQSKTPPETYEQCVNRSAYESSKTGRRLGAAAGCAAAAAAVVPGGPVAMGGMCIVGGIGGYYAGADGGANKGETDGKVECDRPEVPGSPSARALEASEIEVSRHAPIKG